MAQRPGPSRNRRYQIAFQQQMDTIQLHDANGIIAGNLLNKMRYEIDRRPIRKKDFAEKMIGRSFGMLEERMKGQRSTPRGKTDHALFQVYDWFQLGRNDQDAVLAGRTPRGYFQEYVRRRPNLVQGAFPRIRNLKLAAHGRLIVPNVLRRLDFELQYNEWTLSQFAFRVFRRLGAGASMRAIMDQRTRHEEGIYQKIKHWLDLPDQERIDFMNGTWPRPAQVPVPQPDPLRYRYLANPDDFDIRNADFRRCIQTEVERQLRVLQVQKNQQSANQTITGKIIEYLDMLEFLTGRSDDLPAQSSLMSLAFMNGVEFNYVELARCITYVLGAHHQKPEDFADVVLNCRPDIFNLLITSPAWYCSEDSQKNIFTEISRYLMKNYEERKAAWLQDFRRAHLNFVVNPCTDTLNVPGFRQRLRWLAQEQLRVFEQVIAGMESTRDPQEQIRHDKARRTKRGIERLLDFLTGPIDVSMDSMVLMRIINLAFMNGLECEFDKLIECTQCVLQSSSDPDTKQKFAKNVIECTDAQLDSLLASPEEYFEKKQHDYHLSRLLSYLTMDCEHRYWDLNTSREVSIGAIGRSISL